MQSRDEFMQMVNDNVEEYGWHATGVFAAEDETGPPFIYTTGCDPEFVIVGLGASQGHGILTMLVEHTKNGVPVVEGDREDVLIEMPVRLKKLPDEAREAMLTVSGAWRGTTDFEAYQVLWPDTEGHLPGDDGMDPDYVAAQMWEAAVEGA